MYAAWKFTSYSLLWLEWTRHECNVIPTKNNLGIILRGGGVEYLNSTHFFRILELFHYDFNLSLKSAYIIWSIWEVLASSRFTVLAYTGPKNKEPCILEEKVVVAP